MENVWTIVGKVVMWYNVMWYDMMWYDKMWYYVIFCEMYEWRRWHRITSYYTTTTILSIVLTLLSMQQFNLIKMSNGECLDYCGKGCNIMWCDMMWYDVIWYDVIWYDKMWYYVMFC